MCMLSCFSQVQLFETPRTGAHLAPLWNSLGKNTGVGCHFLLQGIFLTHGLNPRLLAVRFFTSRATWEAPKKYFCREKEQTHAEI